MCVGGGGGGRGVVEITSDLLQRLIDTNENDLPARWIFK